MVLIATAEKAFTARLVAQSQPQDHVIDADRARYIIAQIQRAAPEDPAQQMSLMASLWHRLHPTDYLVDRYVTPDGFGGTPKRVLPQAEPDAEAAAILNAFCDSLPNAANGAPRPPRFGDRNHNLSYDQDPPTTTRRGYSRMDAYEG